MSSQWYCHLQDVSHGPLTTETVVEMIRRGQVVQDTPLCEIPDNEWHPASSFSLFEAYFDTPHAEADYEAGYNDLGTYLDAPIGPLSNRKVAAHAKRLCKGKWASIMGFVLLVTIATNICGALNEMNVQRRVNDDRLQRWQEWQEAMLQESQEHSKQHLLGAEQQQWSPPRMETPKFSLSLFGIQIGGIIITMAITSALMLSQAIYFLNITRGVPADFSLLLRGYRYWFKSFILQMAITIFVLLWSLLLIVPGIIAAYAYAQAWYILAENPELSCREILRQSRQRMLGSKARLFYLSCRLLPPFFLLVLVLICVSGIRGNIASNDFIATILGGIGGAMLSAYWYSLSSVFYTALPRAAAQAE